MESARNMCDFSREGSTARRATVVVVVVLYALVASTADLFHNDEYQFKTTDAAHTDVIPANDQCPACTFLAGHSSTGADYGPALTSFEYLLISRFSPNVTVAIRDEWTFSVVSRAPPSKVIS